MQILKKITPSDYQDQETKAELPSYKSSSDEIFEVKEDIALDFLSAEDNNRRSFKR
jgi:hypothetical protein